MTSPVTAVGPTLGQRWRTLRWVLLTLAAITAVSVVSAYLSAPRPGGRMDPEATSADGAHALVALLRDHGVEVVVAQDVSEVEASMRPDSLLLVAQTQYLVGGDALDRLSHLPGDRLLVEPVSRTREALAPKVDEGSTVSFGGEPNCDMREARQAGNVELGFATTYEATGDTTLTSCYDGGLVRYTDGGRTVTVVGSADFMLNSGLLTRGNAALAMNLAGTQPRVVWYAPELVVGESDSSTSLSDLIPPGVTWLVLQLCLAVLLAAWWKGRRVGPLVAEELPVVVRASETVEGRGRLYRSRRARDRAAEALRTAVRQRTLPRLGLDAQSPPAAVVQAVVDRTGYDHAAAAHWLYGPPPATDDELVELAHRLDDIERQVALA